MGSSGGPFGHGLVKSPLSNRLEVTDRRSAGCAPSTPERACFLAPASKTGRPLRAGARGLPGGPGTGSAVRCSARATACPGRNRLRGLQTYAPEERGEDARAGVRRRIRFGCGSFGEPPEGHSALLMAGGECAPCRRPKAGSKAADEREQGKERDAEAGPDFAQGFVGQAFKAGTARPPTAAKPEAARRGGGRPIQSKSSGHQEQSAAEHPKRSARMPADRPPADGGSAARGQRASTSGAAQRRTLPSPASSRARSLTGRAEGLACRVLFISHAA